MSITHSNYQIPNMKPDFLIAQGTIDGYGSITVPGQFGDYHCAVIIDKPHHDLYECLRDQHLAQLERFPGTAEVAPAPFFMRGGALIIRLKWKDFHIDNSMTVLVDQEGEPLEATNAELQCAKIKFSFVQTSWHYQGRIGTKCTPRKFQLLEYGTIDSLFEKTEPELAAAGGDF